MDVFAFFACDKVVLRTTDEKYDIIGYPQRFFYAKEFPSVFSISCFVEVRSAQKPNLPLEVGLRNPLGILKWELGLPFQSSGMAWGINGPLEIRYGFPMEGPYSMVLGYNKKILASFPLIAQVSP